MTMFDDREKAFEAKWRNDQEARFRIQNRRNRLLGEWAAGQLGLSGDEATAYAREVVSSDFEKPGDEDVHDKVHADLQARGVDLSDHRLRRKMTELLEIAEQQVMRETGQAPRS